MENNNEILNEGYNKSVDLLRQCATKHGFIASTKDVDNYKRIWGRDGSIIGIAALLTDDEELIETTRITLETLLKQQGPHGEIPSNYDPKTNRISYGGTAGRVDANLWFLICCGSYLRKTKDKRFFDIAIESIEKVRFLLGAWEFNNRGLLYIPMTGDWADEYVHHGYILFDQLLYYWAQIEICAIHKFLHKSSNHQLENKVSSLKHMIQANYWFNSEVREKGDIYHEVLFEKGKKTAEENECKYWYSFFTPAGYGYRFDALANVMASLFGIASPEQSILVDNFIQKKIVNKKIRLLPAFYPVITPKDENWSNLKMSFTYTFKNKPYEFHNGGLWPFVTGFYVADLAQRGKKKLAKKYLSAINEANKMESNGNKWSFPEFVHGKKLKPGGMIHLGWNAALSIVAHHSLAGSKIFQFQEYDELI